MKFNLLAKLVRVGRKFDDAVVAANIKLEDACAKAAEAEVNAAYAKVVQFERAVVVASVQADSLDRLNASKLRALGLTDTRFPDLDS